MPVQARTPQNVAARYIGPAGLRLSNALGPYLDAHGQRRTNLYLTPGDTLMLPDVEVLGQTYLFDPKSINDPLWLGVGRVVLPEHATLSERELAVLGYEFHAGRSDFEPMPLDAATTPSTPPAEPSAYNADGTPLAFNRSEQGD